MPKLETNANQSSALSEAALAAGPEGIGALPYFGFHGIDLWGGTSAGVNLANGNLYISSNDLSLSAPGVSVQLSRHYNSQETAQNSLGTWTSQHGQDVRLQIAADSIQFHGPSGFYQSFTLTNGAWVSPAGLNADIAAEGAGWKITFTRSGEQMFFDAAGLLTKDVDRNGVGNNYGYTNGALTSIVDAAGRQTTITTAGTTTTYVSPDGRQLEYLKNSAGQLERMRLNAGSLVATEVGFEYDASGKLSWMGTPDDSDTLVPGTQFIYDDQNRIIEMLQKADRTGTNSERSTKFEYGAGSTVVVDPENQRSTFTIDAMGRIIQAIDQMGRERSQEWTANSDISSALSSSATGGPASSSTTFEYDNGNNLTKATIPTGAAASLAYAVGPDCPDAQAGNPNRPKCSTDPAGNRTSMTYDPAGNQLSASQQGPTGVEQSTYLREIADRSICGAFIGSVCKITDPAGGVTSLTYNTAGDVIQIVAPLGTSTYSYDAISRLVGVTDTAGDVTTYSLNARDQIRSTSIARPGQPARVMTSSTPVDRSVTNTTTDSNFASGQLETLKRGSFYGDPAGRYFSPSEADFISQTAYANVDGTLAELANQVSGSSASNYYSYNAANQLTNVTTDNSVCSADVPISFTQDCVAISYDYRGRESVRAFPGGGTRSMEWDESDRATRITVKDGTQTVVHDVAYTYASSAGVDQGLIQTKTSNKEAGISAGAVTTYAYDKQNRLASATERSGSTINAAWAYTYDSRGNRTQQVRSGNTGLGAGTINYSYDAANRLTGTNEDPTGWTHDSAGNLTGNPARAQSYAYGSALQLESATTDSSLAVEFEYWGAGNTSRTTVGSETEIFDRSGVIQDSTAPQQTIVRTPSGEIVSSARRGPDDRQYYVTDAQGSVITILNSYGYAIGNYSYDPYGDTRAVEGYGAESNKYRYVGQKLDENGLYKMGARYYDPALGRFTQQDPSGQNPHYTYAGNNPINNSDRTGLNFWDDFIGSAAPRILGGVVLGTVALAGKALGFTGVGLAVSAAAGCAAGLITTGVSAEISGTEASAGTFAGNCVGGAIASSISFGIGGALATPKGLP